ncbi:MFS transporter [Actinospica durhamensis]|uniref:MFS transporter n=1 Tax=Actinospica durhamensis TaxID=1508375 RepID=A0A941EQ10_9ACTN|nr:MFS transporter [Actinospica durhamensis]MBR7835041.1 MFS transporter [Actinospica durhamensis]
MGETSVQAAPAPAPAGPGSLWRHRNFMLLWGGQSVSLVGSAVSTLALPLVALTVLKSSTFQIGALTAASGLPAVLFGLPAGAFVDRWRKRRLMIWCDLARALALGSVPVAAVAGRLTLAQLYAVAFVTGALAVFFDAAYQSYLPRLVTRQQLMQGNGKLSSSDGIALLVGPSLGGFLVGLVGAAKAVTADALSYLVSALSLALIREPEPERRPERRRPVRTIPAEVGQGLRYLMGDRLIRPVVLSNATGSFFLAALNALWMVYAVRNLDWSAHALGLVLGLGSLGGILGGFIAGPLTERFGVPRVMLAARLALAPGELVIPLAPRGLPGQAAVAAGFALVLVAGIMFNSTQRTFRQLVCPPALLGRLNASTRWLQWCLRLLGALGGGALATACGLRLTLFVASVGLFLTAVSLFVLTPLRRMRDLSGLEPGPETEAAR